MPYARTRARPSLWTVLAAVASAAALAVCGCASQSSNPAAGSNGGIKAADCMRAHGVPNFPDPGPGGGISLPSNIDPQSPAYLSAQADCRSLLPGALPGIHRQPAPGAVQQMLSVSRCMRGHGVTGFPDPVIGPPNPAGYSMVFGRGGVFIAVPTTIKVGPAFTRAARACGFGPPPGSKAAQVPLGP